MGGQWCVYIILQCGNSVCLFFEVHSIVNVKYL